MTRYRRSSGIWCVLIVVLCAGCRGDDSDDGRTAGAASTNADTRLEAQTADMPVPIAPDADLWHERLDDPSTPLNEAAADFAELIDPTFGELYEHLYRWLVGGGRLVLLVGGSRHEDSAEAWSAPVYEWVRRLSKADTQCAVLPVVQINYRIGSQLPGVTESWFNGLAYWPSVEKGVQRLRGALAKAVSAGSGDIWLFGGSKGSHIVGNVLAESASLPELARGFCFAVPHVDVMGVRARIAPPWDDEYRRSGLFKFDAHNDHAFFGKLVVFNKFGDHWANNIRPWQFWELNNEGHQYGNAWANEAFRQRVLDVMRDPAWVAEDRAAGKDFDF
ncbi:MAG: hypothetical protein HYY16_10285 [Planctomycetes bacterium]|nr:hypothetical protein [Planctomycetota bacterium]